LKLKFTITFNDIFHTYIGVQHTRNDDKTLQLTQTKLLHELFEKLDITNKTSQLTPSIENATCENPTGLYDVLKY
jgi:hypothetical protein